MTDRERDAAMERLLRRTLADDDGVPASACLDVETLAAWSDGALTAAERSSAESHAAGCARCEAALAAMIRTSVTTSSDGAAIAPSLIRRWGAWLLPAMAAATAIALWVAVDRTPAVKTPVVHAPAAPDAAPAGSVAGRVAQSAPLAEQPRTPAEVQKKAVDKDKEERSFSSARAARGRAGAAGGAVAEPSAGALADRRQNELKDAPRDTAGARAAAEAPASKLRAERDTQTTAAIPAAPPVSTGIPAIPQRPQAEPQSTQQIQAPPPAPQQQTGAIAETVTVRSRQSAAEGRAGSMDQIARRADEMQFASRVLDITVPGSSIRWRVAGGTELLRSGDGGATWLKQAIEIAAPIVAGAAPSSTVCWLVGRSGTVLVTTDGTKWQRVAFPEAVDLRTVAAPDARNATVTAVDGRTFVTADSGQTWTRR
jgi:Photosynthesis system II assembly factor YCF48